MLKYVGAAYILWLAFHVARSKPETQTQSGFSFWRGFWLEFVNIKIILYAITIYTGYVLPHAPALPSLLLHALGITAIGVAGTLTWAALGSAFMDAMLRPENRQECRNELVMKLEIVRYGCLTEASSGQNEKTS